MGSQLFNFTLVDGSTLPLRINNNAPSLGHIAARVGMDLEPLTALIKEMRQLRWSYVRVTSEETACGSQVANEAFITKCVYVNSIGIFRYVTYRFHVGEDEPFSIALTNQQQAYGTLHERTGMDRLSLHCLIRAIRERGFTAPDIYVRGPHDASAVNITFGKKIILMRDGIITHIAAEPSQHRSESR